MKPPNTGMQATALPLRFSAAPDAGRWAAWPLHLQHVDQEQTIMASLEFDFQYPNGPHITRSLTEEALKQFMNRWDIKTRDVGTGWVWYRLPVFQDGSLKIGMDLGFHHGNLQEITVFHDDPTVYGSAWSDGSEAKEQLRAQNIRSWFEAKGFPVGTYPWGEIWITYDAQSGFGGGGVRYYPIPKAENPRPVTRRIIKFIAFYIVLAALCALLKVATRLFNDESWAEVLFVIPVGATGVAWLHSFLVSRIMERRKRRAKGAGSQ